MFVGKYKNLIHVFFLYMDLLALAKKEAESETEKHGAPHPTHLQLSFDVGQRLAKELDADAVLVGVGTLLMDIKLGEALQAGKLSEHVTMSAKYAKALLDQWGVVDQDVILNCVEAHHGTIPYTSLEAEICANADCYRFLHPTGIMAYLTLLGQREDDFTECLKQLEGKVDEKWSILSLAMCKQELAQYYEQFKEWIANAMAVSSSLRSR
jgi:hypothetical protein